MSEKYLNKLVTIRDAQGGLVGIGHCISYTDEPTIGVNLADGSQVHWIADLCDVSDLKEDAVEALAMAVFRRGQ